MSSSKRRSCIWSMFTLTAPGKAQCNLCNTVQSCKGGSTGNLLRHLRGKHGSVNADGSQIFIETNPTATATVVEQLQPSKPTPKKQRLNGDSSNADEVLVSLLKTRLAVAAQPPKITSPIDELSLEVRSFICTIGAKLETIPPQKRNQVEAQIFALVSTAIDEVSQEQQVLTDEHQVIHEEQE